MTENKMQLNLDTKLFLLRMVFMVCYAIIYSARQLHRKQWRSERDTLDMVMEDLVIINRRAKSLYETETKETETR